MDRSWLRDEKLKADISEWWRSRFTFGQTTDQLVTKLKDLRHHLFHLRRQSRVARTQARNAALMRVRLLDAAEDLRPLLADEDSERKVCQRKIIGSRWTGDSGRGYSGLQPGTPTRDFFTRP